MRHTSLGLQYIALGVAQAERGAVVDRRASEGELPLALELQLLRRLIAGIEVALIAQALGDLFIQAQALGLAHRITPSETEPAQVLLDRADELGP